MKVVSMTTGGPPFYLIHSSPVTKIAAVNVSREEMDAEYHTSLPSVFQKIGHFLFRKKAHVCV